VTRSKGKKKAAPKKTAPSWPQERSYMERPDRYKYVRKEILNPGCVFCMARDMGVNFKSLCLYKSKHVMVILNKFPYNSGHLMVLPCDHIGDVAAMSEQSFVEMSRLLKKTIEIVMKEYNCEGVNVGMNMGAVAGAGIPAHLHWHIIPRWYGDTNFFPLIAETKVVPETLEQVFERYLPHFSKGFLL
jgi:ATP adenylyltransferase